jgi:uncharacterized protein
MELDLIEYVYTFGMDGADVIEALQTNDVGVLALANDGAAYAVPVSFHFDGSSLYLRLADDGLSKKAAYVSETSEACFVIYGVEPPDGSWSVVITGLLRELPDSERDAFDDAALNDEFFDLRLFDEEIDEVAFELYEFQVSEITGRKTAERVKQ